MEYLRHLLENVKDNPPFWLVSSVLFPNMLQLAIPSQSLFWLWRYLWVKKS